MLLSTVAMDATVAEQRDFEIFEKIRKRFICIYFSKIKNRLLRFYAHYNQPLCQNFSARSVKNCMTSMQLYSDHPCRLPACFILPITITVISRGGALGRVQNLRRQYCWVT